MSICDKLQESDARIFAGNAVSKMNSLNRFIKSDKNWAVICVAYVLFLILFPFIFSLDFGKWFISDDGPFEILSLTGWAVLALLFTCSPFRATVKWPMATLFILFTAREASWHKAFTSSGMLKLSYYVRSPDPLAVKLIAGIFGLLFFGTLIYGGFLFFQYLIKGAKWKSAAGFWLIAAAATLFISQIFDRAPAILAGDYGVHLSPMVDFYFDIFEQGLELLAPAMLIWVACVKRDRFDAFK